MSQTTTYARKIVGTKHDKRGWSHKPRNAKPSPVRIVPQEQWGDIQATIIARPERFTV